MPSPGQISILGGGGLFYSSQIVKMSKLKVPSPGQISILGGGGLFYSSQIVKMSKLKVPSPGQISIGGGGGYSTVVKTESARSWPNFNFRGGVDILQYLKLEVSSPGQLYYNYPFQTL